MPKPEPVILTGGSPPAGHVAKLFPPVGRLRLYRLASRGRFVCARCAQPKVARLVAVHDHRRLVCNACYGWLLNRDPAGQADLGGGGDTEQPAEPGPSPPRAEPDQLLGVLAAVTREVHAAKDLVEVLYLARRAFAIGALVCEHLTFLRPVEYLKPLASARDAAAEAADLLDEAPSAPPPPPIPPGAAFPVLVVGGGLPLRVPLRGSMAARQQAERAQRVADAVVELAATITASLRRVVAEATDPADQHALGEALVRAAALADGAGADPRQGW